MTNITVEVCLKLAGDVDIMCGNVVLYDAVISGIVTAGGSPRILGINVEIEQGAE